jgi:DNA-binding MarR family transcriptional regulator
MNNPLLSLTDISILPLLRHAQAAYGTAMRKALAEAEYDDIPKNGLYIIGGLARQAESQPLGQLIDDLRISKQAAGQLVDTLVIRGYLKRDVDSGDRRRLTVALTDHGRAVASILGDIRASIDSQLIAQVGPEDIELTRQALLRLIDIGHTLENDDDHDHKHDHKPEPAQSVPSIATASTAKLVNIHNAKQTLSVQNANLSGSHFSHAKLAQSRFDDIDLQQTQFTNINLTGTTFANVNLSKVSISNANLEGMTINDILVTDLLRVYQSHAK